MLAASKTIASMLERPVSEIQTMPEPKKWPCPGNKGLVENGNRGDRPWQQNVRKVRTGQPPVHGTVFEYQI
jgi:hypothetical protein